MPEISPYGSWKSPFTSAMVATSSISLEEVAVDGADIYWRESRPEEGGRYTIIHRRPDGSTSELTPREFNVRTRVHEYGGGAFTVTDGVVYFVNDGDQQLYRQPRGGLPRRLATTDGCRYADLTVDPARSRLICIREDHRGSGEAINTIVSVDCTGEGSDRVLAAGNDFYASARLSPDGRQLAYLTWNHPNMPWDGCELWVADVEGGGELSRPSKVAGGVRESVFQPAWSPEGILHFVSDRSGWWNLYRWDGRQAEVLCPMEAEFGRSQFQFGMSQYDVASQDRILCSYSRNGSWHLAWLDTVSQSLSSIENPFTEIAHLACGDGFAVFIGGSPDRSSSLMQLDFQSGQMKELKHSREEEVDRSYISMPEALEFQTDGRLTSHAFYYPPYNPDCAAPPDELPPLVVMSHGGPTGAATTSLNYAVQFWTSRGFGYLDVNYGGSIGYGRAYRQRLDGNWGIVDVEDCCRGALSLAHSGRVDPRRMAIRGRSAGGYTTLACLAFRSEVFAAGASLYGVADLETFVKDTHKFESHYLTSLVGPFPARRDLYFERSPIHFVGNFGCPLILLQGDEDRVVPPDQARMMYAAVHAKGLPVALVMLKGEQHGFRQAPNIKRALEAELYFYSRVFGFTPADPIEAVPIENI